MEMEERLWTLIEMAETLHLSVEKVRKKVITRDGFPLPANSAYPEKWRAEEVLHYLKTTAAGPARKKATRSLAHISERNAQLYRHFDDTGRLLYVGISITALKRTMQHRGKSHWFREVCTITIEHFATRAQAEAAEIVAIQTEKPLHNLRHVIQ